MPSPIEPAVITNPPTLARERVSDGVTAYLRDLIISGQLRAGEALRVEHLAAQLSVSVTPIRESLVELLGEGFVDRAPRRGYAVALLSRTDILDVFAANSLLSGELAARATSRVTPELLQALEAVQRDLERAGKRKEYADMEELNHRLHRLINNSAQSPKLAWFVQRTSHYAPRWTWSKIKGWPSASASEHRSVLKALQARDAQAARQSMQDHVNNAGTLLVEHLDAQGFWSPRDGANGRFAVS